MDEKLYWEISSNLKKYDELNGYTCDGYSVHSVIKHLSRRFAKKVKDKETGKEYYVSKWTVSELEKAYWQNKIKIRGMHK
jgi:hypothetical protein